MEYKPRLPKRNSNVSHEHPLREFFILIGGSAALIVGVYWLLGLFIDIAVDYISPATEQSLYRAVGIDTAFTADEGQTEATANAQRLLSELDACMEVGYPVHVSVSAAQDVNAFAAPGGQIILMGGVIAATQSENGLAFVLAHELAHFKSRDHLRSMGRGVVLLAISVLITGADSDLSTLATPVNLLEGAQFSQERENAADAIALAALNCHYGHVGGATELFAVLAQQDDAFDLTFSHYFSSHPEAEERIAAIQELTKSYGYAVADTRELPENLATKKP
jgi:Zn-dependent protease with chaperone function